MIPNDTHSKEQGRPMKTGNSGWRYALLVLGLAVLAAMVMDFNRRTADLRRLTTEKEAVSAQVTSLVETQNGLKEQVAYATSDAAVMEWAYQDGHMIRPGDVPVIPVPADQVTPAPTPTPAPSQVQTSNWEKWLILFTGPKAP
jgi:cell division protein FtsB